jgi:ethanolamine utilization protein EutS
MKAFNAGGNLSPEGQELLQSIYADAYERAHGGQLRITRVTVPGKEITLAHIIGVSEYPVYKNMALDIGFHEGDDPTGKALGILHMCPWESVVIGGDMAVKMGNVDIGFMDRFCGSLILTGEREDIKSAVYEIVRYFGDDLGYPVCKVTEQW